MNALILFSYSSIQSLDDIQPFYDHLTHGHATPATYERGRRLFTSIGTADPLATVTNRIGRALISRLEQETGQEWKYYIGTKHSHPFVEEAVTQSLKDGADHIYTLSLTPLYSKTGTRVYERTVVNTVEKLGKKGVEITHIPAMYDNDTLAGLLADRLKNAIHWLPHDVRGEAEIIFTSHSMPGNERTQHDFIRQFEKLAENVMTRSPLKSYRLAYRSATPGKQPWLEPDILDVIRQVKKEGKRAVIVSELLSIIENAEVVKEIGHDAHQLAESLDMTFVQTEYLNDSFDFVQFLIEYVLAVK
jgi:ferrochelatase